MLRLAIFITCTIAWETGWPSSSVMRPASTGAAAGIAASLDSGISVDEPAAD
jgi:hypothetical protein